MLGPRARSLLSLSLSLSLSTSDFTLVSRSSHFPLALRSSHHQLSLMRPNRDTVTVSARCRRLTTIVLFATP
jgi:hypothetical protein